MLSVWQSSSFLYIMNIKNITSGVLYSFTGDKIHFGDYYIIFEVFCFFLKTMVFKSVTLSLEFVTLSLDWALSKNHIKNFCLFHAMLS